MTVILLLTVAAISAAGSLQAGPVNSFVLRHVLRNGKAGWVWICIGGSLPEVLYAAVAAELAHIFANKANETVFNTIGPAVLLVVGISMWRAAKKKMQAANKVVVSPTSRFFSAPLVAFMLGMLNPQLIVFWGAQAAFLMSTGLYADGYGDKAAFASGAGIGAFALLAAVAFAGGKLENMADKRSLVKLESIIGVLLIVLSVARLGWLWVGRL